MIDVFKCWQIALLGGPFTLGDQQTKPRALFTHHTLITDSVFDFDFRHKGMRKRKRMLHLFDYFFKHGNKT